MNGRDGFTREQLSAMWPKTPNVTCSRCPPWERYRGTCTVTLVGVLCDECLEFERWRYSGE